MDDSSICKAAIAAKLAVDKELSVFSFELGPPLKEYDGCMMYGKSTRNFASEMPSELQISQPKSSSLDGRTQSTL